VYRKTRSRPSFRETIEKHNASDRYYAAAFGKEPAFQCVLPPKRDRIRRPVDGKPVIYEKDIQKAILQALALRKDVVFVGRFNRGQAVATDGYGNTRYTNFNTVRGFPDIHGLLLGGRAFYLEVKRPGSGRVSDDQRAFLDKALGGGAFAGVATSVEEAMQILPPFRA